MQSLGATLKDKLLFETELSWGPKNRARAQDWKPEFNLPRLQAARGSPGKQL